MRKLATFAFAFAAGVFAANYVIPAGWMIYASAGIFVLGLGAFFLSSDKRLRAILICLALSVGILWSWGYGRIFLGSVDLLCGETAEMSVTVTDYPQETDYGKCVYVSAAAEGKAAVKAAVYIYDSSADDAKPGDIMIGVFEFYESNENEDFYNSRGVFLRAIPQGEVTIEHKSSSALRYLPVKASRAVRLKIDSIFTESTAPFMRALLTGDKSALNRDNALAHALQTTGVSHIVAVSGMHMSFVVSLVMLLSGRKKSKALMCIPFIVVFMLITGNAPSVVRAGIMQILMIFAPVVRREADPWTNLGFALMVILGFNPYAAQNVGLQLSFAAVVGIILVTPKISKALFSRVGKLRICKVRPCRAALSFVCSTVASTAGAVIFTTPLTALHFKYVSVISPITNILTLWAVSAAFSLGLFACVFAFIVPPVGVALAFVSHLFVQYIIFTVRLLARIPFAAVYTGNLYMRLWLFYIFAMGAVMLLSKGLKHRAVIFGASFVLSFAAAVVLTLIGTSALEITVIDAGQGQCIVLRSNGRTAVIDCGGNIRGGVGNAAANYLASLGETRVDCIVLTHYHNDHTNGLEDLLGRLETDFVIAPELVCDSGEETLHTAGAAGSEMMKISKLSSVSLGDTELLFLPPVSDEGGDEECMAVMIRNGDFEMLVMGDMTAEMEEELVSGYALKDIEVLQVSHHGSKFSTAESMLSALKPEIAVISVGKNSYGHPADETLERIQRANCTLYRTDINGNITIRTG